jgi:ABC-type nitrate/sulfonate/bicarbonate transport system substrate-binding protein
MKRAFGPLCCIGVVVALAALDGLSADVQAEPNISTMVFQGIQNLPLYAAQQKGFFAKRGIAVDQRIAANSKELRDGLAQGRYQIVHTAVDNAIAMAEQAKVDVVVVLGGDNGWNDLIAQPDIKAYGDFRGKTVVVDAPDTAFAFQLYKMLKLNGVGQNEYTVKPVGATRFRLQAMTTDKSIAGAMLNLPFSFMAQQAGLKRFATAVDVIGPYLSTTAFTLRSWALENSDTLARYIQAYIDGLRWALESTNKTEATDMLAKGLNISQELAERSYQVAVDPKTGFMKDARIDLAGFQNVLRLRAELHGDWGGVPPSTDRYLDLSYYQRALEGL